MNTPTYFKIFPLFILLAASYSWSEAQRLNGDEIRAKLNGMRVVFQDGTAQNFYQDGSTLYFNALGRPDRGAWKVESNQYCSWWSGSGWDCYWVEGQDNQINFKALDGRSQYPGEITGKIPK